MRYPTSVLEEIKVRLPLSSVVGKRVQLKKAGREWKGLSPFNAEKSPSFYVNDQKGFFHCFSSGKHGDHFGFLMETEGLSFSEAVERLAQDAGVSLPSPSPRHEESERKRRSLYDVLELAAQFFEKNLREPYAKNALIYLDQRELSGSTRQRFRLGYAAPDRFALRDHLASKDISRTMMTEAGLLVSGEDINIPYDRFRDRIMFPIQDIKGRVIAFGGRALSKDVPAKYLNSPETPLFHKGAQLYNLHQARASAHEKGTIIAVEGYMDVIGLSQIGIEHVVAPLGTALTEEQLKLLWRYADEPILCFDGDKAGERAAFRAIDVALPHLAPGKSLRFALLPEGQDPDDLARQGGAPVLGKLFQAARPLFDMLWARETDTALDTPERRAAVEQRLRESLNLIRDESVRRYYREAIEERVGPKHSQRSYQQNPYQKNIKGRYDQRKPSPSSPITLSPALTRNALFAGKPTISPREAMILGAFMAHPDLLNEHAETLAHLELNDKETHAIRSLLLDCAARSSLTRQGINQALSQAGLNGVFQKITARMNAGDRWILDEMASFPKVQDTLKQALILHHRIHTLHSELKAAELALGKNNLGQENDEAHLSWLKEVQNQLLSLEGTETDEESHKI